MPNDHERAAADAQPRARPRASGGGKRPLHPRQCRAAAAVHVRGRQAGRFDGRGGRQAQVSDADDDRLHPLRRLNPYWYVPPDLAAERIAPKVVKQGLKYLDELGYQMMSDWTPDSEIIDPKTIDWKAVADGKVEVMIRQKPGPHNSMGRMKFMFPNEAGVYLHDNPRARALQRGVAALQRRLRPARGCAAAGPLAVRPRPRLGRRGDRAAGAAADAGAGLHHLSDRDARGRRRSLITTTSTAATQRSSRDGQSSTGAVASAGR